MRLSLLLLCFYCLPALGQDVLSDSLFMQWVYRYHPVAKQAYFKALQGKAKVREARGAFDPEAFWKSSEKEFQDKNYYLLRSGGLRIPTWFGVELSGGFKENSGAFLNPQNSLPPGGQWNVGVKVPLGQNLFIDERRAQLRKAQLFNEFTDAEQQRLLNDLLFDATEAYWTWVENFYLQAVFEEALALSEERFAAVRDAYLAGDNPAIDTLEAYIQMQTRQLSLQEQNLKYQKVSLELSNYLWLDDGSPLEIGDSLRPPKIALEDFPRALEPDTIPNLQEAMLNTKPELRQLGIALRDLDIDRRLQTEYLKPKLNLEYNLLSRNNATFPAENQDLLIPANYTFGVEFSYPLFLRKTRGKLRYVKLESDALSQKQDLEIQKAKNKLLAYFQEQRLSYQQLAISEKLVQEYGRLLEGERVKFDNGESSLFLVNSREIKWIENQGKYWNTYSKYRIARTAIFWHSGLLPKQLEDSIVE